ncbi:MAG: hypothetical protein ACI9X4_001525 [Glaciecola sp.]|jgi:hypothetical protein
MMMKPMLCVALLLPLVVSCAATHSGADQGTWFKGNTHTHTLWSDGDGAPEISVAWYKEHGYQFLVLSDHNIFQDSEFWFPVADDGKGRLKPDELDQIIAQFGADAVQLREVDGKREMRLLTLDELADRFEESGRFLLVPGEEVTASFEGHPVHINAINIAEAIPVLKRDSVVELLNATLEAISAHGEEHDRSVLAHLNHPNFGWGLTWQEVASMRADRFFEVYNGHQGVRNHGDATHPSTDEMWDRALTLRLTELKLPLLFAVATDDAHHYYGNPTAQTGRGWIMVQAETLEENALVDAMKRGDFYASSGVTLRDVKRGEKEYRVEIDTASNAQGADKTAPQFTTRFIGTRIIDGALSDVGEVLLETTNNPALYTYSGDELYVRAVVTSSKDHPNPYAKGDKEKAWTQPVQVTPKQ